ELAVLHADADVVDEIGHAAGGVDLIVGAAGGAGLGRDDLDAILELLLDHHDARQACIGGRQCDVKLHRRCASLSIRTGAWCERVIIAASPRKPTSGSASASISLGCVFRAANCAVAT